MEYNVGDKVCYIPKLENGIVKSIHENGHILYVVYKCGEDWENYMSYTGESTNIEDLRAGWITDRDKISAKIKEDSDLLNRAIKDKNSVAQSVISNRIKNSQEKLKWLREEEKKEPDTKISEIL
jgi:hypothetical protein